MGYAEAATIVHAPVEAVWNCLNDIARTPEWVSGLVDAELKTPEPYGAGAEYVDHNQLGPFPQTTVWRVTVFEPMTRQVHESESAVLPSKMTLTLAPAPEGALLRMTVDYHFLPRLGVFGRLMERLLMNRMLGSVLKQNQTSLDAYLQRPATGAP